MRRRLLFIVASFNLCSVVDGFVVDITKGTKHPSVVGSSPSFSSDRRRRPSLSSFLPPSSWNGGTKMSSDWSSFQDLDDDDGMRGTPEFANENDSPRARVGSALEAPIVEWDGDPLFVPQGSVVPLTVQNVQALLAACRMDIGTVFGYTAENRGVGITGFVDFVDLDGPIVILKLGGRFWHQRPTVLSRVARYLMTRIPEIIDVVVENEEWELSDDANNAAP